MSFSIWPTFYFKWLRYGLLSIVCCADSADTVECAVSEGNMPKAQIQVMCISSAQLLFETVLVQVIGILLCALWPLYMVTVNWPYENVMCLKYYCQ